MTSNGDTERSPLTRRIAISLAALIVLGAGLAILQTDASVRESNTARETTRVAVRAMRANVATNTVLGVEAGLEGERDFLPFRRPLTAGGPSLAEAAGLSAASGKVAHERRSARQSLPGQRISQVLDDFRIDAERSTLKQQALATTRITWNTRSTQYTTVIAVLAAALFLVGFGLIVDGPIRSSTYALGIALGLFAAGWAIWIYLLPIPSTPPGAVDAAARGAVLTANADYTRALAAYDRSLEIDGGYATAYTGRSRARLLQANPDYPVTRAFTDVDGRDTVAAVRDAERGLQRTGNRNFLGLVLVAYSAFYTGAYARVVEAADMASAINPLVPDVWLVKSAAQVALGDQTAADRSLARALELLKGAEPSQRTRLLASSYLSYLAWLAWREPRLAPAAARLSDRLIERETMFTLGRPLDGALPATGTVHVDGLRFADGRLHVLLRWRGLPANTALSAVAYERPLADGAWTQPPDLALFGSVSGSGERRISVPLRRRCEPTAVRADVYLDGALALSRTGPGAPATC